MDSSTKKSQHDLQLCENFESSPYYSCLISFLESIIPVEPENNEGFLFAFILVLIFYMWIFKIFYTNDQTEDTEGFPQSDAQIITKDTTEEIFLESSIKEKEERAQKVREREEMRREVRRLKEQMREKQEKEHRIKDRIKRREEQTARRKKKKEKMISTVGESEENEEVEE
ncbi:Plasmodium exported protein, unknown function [Plasmodium relictum]|uniref:Uncharacterized protein n=1 Tax=Plasmodium relictum TaxID=85471 RepID=A0A1J1HBW3_PLARL|nr:Plasmodium exported protein, unknown function [Plasmodium relictum]CRH02940.1 Plasmodium exported protein, unknown function [Plasmodium relictum]